MNMLPSWKERLPKHRSTMAQKHDLQGPAGQGRQSCYLVPTSQTAADVQRATTRGLHPSGQHRLTRPITQQPTGGRLYMHAGRRAMSVCKRDG